MISSLTADDISRIIEMAWEDRTPFEAIAAQFAVSEAEVIALMRTQLKRRSFWLWRQRVSGRSTKHVELRSDELNDQSRHRSRLRSPKR